MSTQTPPQSRRPTQFGQRMGIQEYRRLEAALTAIQSSKQAFFEELLAERPAYPGFCFYLNDLSTASIREDMRTLERQLAVLPIDAVKGTLPSGIVQPHDIYFALSPKLSATVKNPDILAHALESRINLALKHYPYREFARDITAKWQPDEVFSTAKGMKVLRFIFQPGRQPAAPSPRPRTKQETPKQAPKQGPHQGQSRQKARKQHQTPPTRPLAIPGLKAALATLGIPYAGQTVDADYMRHTIHPKWRKLARENHPDLHPDDKVREERLKRVNAAYAHLGKISRQA